MKKHHNGITGNDHNRVYFLHNEAGRAVKIGMTSNDVESRRRGSQTGNHQDLVLLGSVPGGRKEEARLHRFFAEERCPGRREWFWATPDVLSVIRMMLVRKGSPRTVADELKRRNKCRFGLRGVIVAIEGFGVSQFVCLVSAWGKGGVLLLDVCPRASKTWREEREREGKRPVMYTLTELLAMKIEKPDDVIEDVPAEKCFLLSDWPIICHCWCHDDNEPEWEE